MKLVIEATRSFRGPRFDVERGDIKTIFYNPNLPAESHRIVGKALNGSPIEWGGAEVASDFYKVIYNGQ